MNSYENPELSYECDLTAERDRLKADRDELIEALQAILDGEYSNYIPSKLFDPARAILARIK